MKIRKKVYGTKLQLSRYGSTVVKINKPRMAGDGYLQL